MVTEYVAQTEEDLKGLGFDNIWLSAAKNYKLEKMIGAGSFGQVAKARCIVTDKIVAIKLIHDINQNEYNYVKIFREMRLLKMMSQPNGDVPVTKLIDLFTAAGDSKPSYFIVMEWMETDLAYLLKTKSSLLTQESAELLFYNSLKALFYIH